MADNTKLSTTLHFINRLSLLIKHCDTRVTCRPNLVRYTVTCRPNLVRYTVTYRRTEAGAIHRYLQTEAGALHRVHTDSLSLVRYTDTWRPNLMRYTYTCRPNLVRYTGHIKTESGSPADSGVIRETPEDYSCSIHEPHADSGAIHET